MKLFRSTTRKAKKFGYRNIQEFIRAQLIDDIYYEERIEKIARRMKKGIGVHGPMSPDEFMKEMEKL